MTSQNETSIPSIIPQNTVRNWKPFFVERNGKKFIDDFQGPNDVFSNFYQHSWAPILYEGISYNSVEAAFQSIKYRGSKETDVRWIFSNLSPHEAKVLGRSIKLRPDWEQIRDQVMMCLLQKKFQNPDLQTMLLMTEDAILIEGNWWHDNYWGRCYCDKCKAGNPKRGNKLGLFLMTIRDNLKLKEKSLTHTLV